MRSNIYSKIIKKKSPLVMGILNITPDSFSDGGKFLSIDNAVKHAEYLIQSGADIIDIGGESTRPGADKVDASEEINRIVPVIKKIKSIFPNSIISIDTYKSQVAEEAVNTGASIINDISGGTFDSNIFSVASTYNVPFIMMHIKGTPKNMQKNTNYNDLINDINSFFYEQIRIANSYGVQEIILDPGIGFGKSLEDNYKILAELKQFSIHNYPLLIGVSKKSFLGNFLKLNIEERENATIIAETISVLNGAKIIRTHNVKNAVELKKIVSLLNQ